MGFTLNSVVPWGRSFDEYMHMFALTKDDLARLILGCGDGPAAFNAGFSARGGSIVSVDPIYAFSRAEIESRIDDTYRKVMDQLRKNVDDYVWTHFKGPDDLGATRMAAMRDFLADYDAGREAGRYVAGDVRKLPFKDGAFDLALVSHFLFLYDAQLTEEFHVEAFTELMRVAREVRVFPVLTIDGRRYPHLESVRRELERRDFATNLVRVDYEFQKGGDEMLTIRRK